MFELELPHSALIGVLHVSALPGAPGYARPRGEPLRDILAAVARDAERLARGGCDALIVENFGDTPFFKTRVPPETIAALTRCVLAARDAAPELAVGVNVLRNDARAALGIAAATGARFVRVNVLSGVAVTDQGLIEGRAAQLARARAALCPDVALWADVHVKHATPLGTATLSQAVEELLLRARADAVIVSGVGTGHAPSVERVREASSAARGARVWIGSGLDTRNAAELLAHADGAIVGTALKRDGRVEAEVDEARVTQLARQLRALPSRSR